MRRFLATLRVVTTPEMAGAYERIARLDEVTISSDKASADYVHANVGTYCHALGTVPIWAPMGAPARFWTGAVAFVGPMEYLL